MGRRIVRRTEPQQAKTLRVGSLFAGIGGFDLAAHALGGESTFWAEFDPSQKKRQPNQDLLATRFPEAVKFGDVSQIDPDDLPDIDVLTAGSPCQGFSVAGYRKGLEDDRSSLFGEFIRIMEALAERGLRWAIFENVPGLLTSNKGQDFANVIAALAGHPEPLRLPRHPNGRASRYSGLVDGPRGQVAWRCLDAQHFGVAQRRNRLFAVVDLGGDRAGEVLLELQGLPGDSSPGEQAGPHAAGTARGSAGERGAVARRRAGAGRSSDDPVAALTGNGVGTCGADDNQAQAGHIVVSGRTEDLAGTVQASAGHHGHSSPRGDGSDNLVVQADAGSTANGAIPLLEVGARTGRSTTDTAVGAGIGNVGDPMFTLQASKQHGVVIQANTGDRAAALLAHGWRGDLDTETIIAVYRKQRRAKDADDFETWVEADESNTLNLFENHNEARTTHAVVVPVQDASGRPKQQNGVGAGDEGDPSYTLDTTGKQGVAVGFSTKDSGGGEVELSPTLRSMSHDGSHMNGGGQAGVAYNVQPVSTSIMRNALTAKPTDTAEAITAAGANRRSDRGDMVVTPPPAVLLTMREGKPGGGKGPLLSEEQSLTLATGNGQVLFEPQGVTAKGNGEAYLTPTAPTLASGGGMPGQGYAAALTQYGVRRLTPSECERLQGFPAGVAVDGDSGWTGGQADSTRYKQLGNAVAVPVATWLLYRVAAADAGVPWDRLPTVHDVLAHLPWLEGLPPMEGGPEQRVLEGGALAFDWQASGASDTSWDGKARSWLVKQGDYAGALSTSKVQAVVRRERSA